MRSAAAGLSAPPRALAALLGGAIDYAGLYPPASWSMQRAVQEYHRQRQGPHAWALGRFVLGAAQLNEFADARRSLRGEAWPLSILAATPPAAPEGGRVAAIEAKGSTPDAIAQLHLLVHTGAEVYVEVPLDAALEENLAAVAAIGARAKVRTGGITADAIPPVAAVARFMHLCAQRGLPFKATAGLHHAVRGEYALTYEPASARGTMFGFLNVFVASILAVQGAGEDELREVLDDRAAASFRLVREGDALAWREVVFPVEQLAGARYAALAGIGSCSFSEPLAELEETGLLVRS